MNTSIKSISETKENLCYVMDLKKEYGPGKVGKEDYALITDLSEDKLKEIYGEELKQYAPYVIMSLAMGEAIFESHRNDWKHLKHQERYGHNYSLSEDDFEEHHPECVRDTDAYTWLLERDCKEIIRLALDTLSDSQRRRVEKHIIDKITITDIAAEECVNWKTVKKSISSACVKMRRFIENSEFQNILEVTKNG